MKKKRLLSLLISSAITFTSLPSADIFCGNINGDGKIKLNDITLLRKYIVSGGTIEIGKTA